MFPIDLHLVVRPCEVSAIYVGMLAVVVIMHSCLGDHSVEISRMQFFVLNSRRCPGSLGFTIVLFSLL